MSKQQFLQLNGYTKAERIQMTDRVSEAISQSGAWITDFQLFSNISICINFQVPNTCLGNLAAKLQETGVHLNQESLDQLTPTDAPLKEEDLSGTLQITFIHNEPDLLRDVPAVPG